MQTSIASAARSSSRALQHPGWVTPLALAVIGLLTRLPLQSRLLYHWDSANFAFALERFDIAEGQPHAPGYLLYVALGHAAAWLTGSAQSGYIAIAIAGTAGAAIALYDLGRRLWSPAAGWLAALFLLASPLFWFYGEVALPHTVDGLVVIVAATLSWRVWTGEHRAALWLAMWLGLAGGFRQQTLVFMFPLAFVASLALPWRQKLGAGALLAATVVAWIVPLFALTGGMGRYLAIVAGYSETFDRPTSVLLGAGWDGLSYNLDKLLRYTLWGWALGIVPALLGAWLERRGLRRFWRDRRFWLMALWAVPCLAFYTLIHMGQQGLIFVYLPILALLSGRGALAVAHHLVWGRAVAIVCLSANALLFLLAPEYLLPGRFKVLSLATIRQQDRVLDAQIQSVRSFLPPDAALLAAEWRLPQYYLPDVLVIPIAVPGAGAARADLVEGEAAEQLQGAAAIAWFEPQLDSLNGSAERTTLAGEVDGVQLRVLRRGDGELFRITGQGFEVVPR